MNLNEWLLHAQTQISRMDALVIAQHALGMSRTQLITQGVREVSMAEDALLKRYLLEILSGRPTAYIVGSKEFYGLEFEVNEAVLVPRPDTELLVEVSLDLIRREEPLQQRKFEVLELGTGSGCIAISVAHEAPHINVTAVDASDAALEVAARNNTRLVNGSVNLLRSDWFSAISSQRFHLIVSNPPYIAEGDAHLAALTHEPQMALTSGADGLEAIRHIIKQAPGYLHTQGALWLEHGYDQATAVQALLRQAGFGEVQSRKDLAGIERASGGRLG